jgi:2-methylcitrate dehydratase PrpD
MKSEQAFASFVQETKFSDLSPSAVEVAKKQILTVFGAAVAGSSSAGCETIADLVRETGGAKQATILIHGGKVPAAQAAFANGVMARALDICDHIQPGLHTGSAPIPAALAAAELAGGCTGKDLLAAVAAGTALSLRLNKFMTDHEYDGLDPTCVCSVFSAAAAASKLLHLTGEQTLHALALAFNRSGGGNLQNHIDGSLAVRVTEGWCAQSGVECANLARLGITGPHNFLEGVYGFLHLYAKDRIRPEQLTADLGRTYHLDTLSFKKYPSCGQTQGSTGLLLKIMDEQNLTADDIDQIDVKANPMTYHLVGHPFKIGKSPRVDAQFSLQYCLSNAMHRRKITLDQFELPAMSEPRVKAFAINRVRIHNVLDIEADGHYTTELTVTAKDGSVYTGRSEFPPGTPKNPMTEEDFKDRFFDCIEYGSKAFLQERARDNYEMLMKLESVSDLKTVIDRFTA